MLQVHFDLECPHGNGGAERSGLCFANRARKYLNNLNDWPEFLSSDLLVQESLISFC
jgi:hypothetical protein